VASVFVNGDISYTGSSNTIVVLCDQGGLIFIRADGGTSLRGEANDLWSTFTATLLFLA